MRVTKPPLRVVCLVGQTGAGKTEAAITLAERLPGEVVNLDSRQLYRDFPIITAQPTPEEQAGVPHHLYGFLRSEDAMTAARFAAMAHATAREVAERGRVPLLVGGTGFYLKAFLEGLADIPEIPQTVREALHRDLQAKGLPALRKRLAQVDTLSAERIHPNDTQRTLRALEVYDATGVPLSTHHAQTAPPTPVEACAIWLDMEKTRLHERLERRIHAMLAAGAVEEARGAWARCPDPTAPGWSGIGCGELLGVLQGKYGMDEAHARWLKHTKAYAKRQRTWFLNKQDFAARLQADAPTAVDQALRLAEEFLH